jgi:hypothetical protein
VELSISGGIALIDESHANLVQIFNWHKTPSGYASTSIKGKKILMHRLLMGAKRCDIVDHINGDRLDNRMENLRFVTRGQNAQNAKRGTAVSGFTGVSLDRGYYKAYIKVRGKRMHLGHFKEPIAAAIMYDHYARKYYGPLAKTNEKHFREIAERLNPDGPEARVALENAGKRRSKKPGPKGVR